jgi:hypothetical protein
MRLAARFDVMELMRPTGVLRVMPATQDNLAKRAHCAWGAGERYGAAGGGGGGLSRGVEGKNPRALAAPMGDDEKQS